MPSTTSHHLPPWALLHPARYQESLLPPGRYVSLLYYHLVVCFAKRMVEFDWFFVEKRHFQHPWLVAPDAALFFLVHTIVTTALCPCQEHYLLCYCYWFLSTTRTVMFVAFFIEKSHSEVRSCWRRCCHARNLAPDVAMWQICQEVPHIRPPVCCSATTTEGCFHWYNSRCLQSIFVCVRPSEVSFLILISISCHHSSSVFPCADADNEMYDFFLVAYMLSLAHFYYHYVDG